MAGERTAAQLVAKVRELIKEKEQTPYRDGFTADAGNATASFSILSALNTVQRMIGSLGYIRASTDTATVAGDADYTLDANIVRITGITIISGATHYPLKKIADRLVDHIRGRAISGTAARPRQYASHANHYILNPVPDAVYTARAFHYRIAADFTEAAPTTTPEGLPSYFHEMLAYGAALFLMSAEIENPAANSRIPYLQSEWRRFWNELSAETKVQPVPVTPFIESSEWGRATVTPMAAT